jgi:hypothetical protein
MSSSGSQTFIVPKCTGKAFRLDRGRSFRVVECEGKQVASLMFFNARNHKEQFMAEFSGGLNFAHPERVGSHYRVSRLYSKVPYENVMLTVTENDLGDHFLGTHCTRTMMEVLGEPGHRSCSDNFTDALAEFGIELADVYSPSVLNAFANVKIDPKGEGEVRIAPPRSSKGDFMEFRAEMDVLVAVSACPDDLTAMNDHACKALEIQILD